MHIDFKNILVDNKRIGVIESIQITATNDGQTIEIRYTAHSGHGRAMACELSAITFEESDSDGAA